MSMGRKIDEALRALEAEGGLPKSLTTGERNKRIWDKLSELGHKAREHPSRRTLARYLGVLRPTCPSPNSILSGNVESNFDPEKEDQMRYSDHRTMIDITGAARTWVQTVPWDHGIHEVLDPAYLNPNYLAFRQGDRVELQASDFS
jgi:hypothetical protein